MSQVEGTDNPVIGKVFGGSLVKKIKESTTERWDGKIKLHKEIYLESGAVLIEDTFHDSVPLSSIEGSFHEQAYETVEYPKSPTSNEKSSKKKKSKKEKKEKNKVGGSTKTKTKSASSRATGAASAAKKEPIKSLPEVPFKNDEDGDNGGADEGKKSSSSATSPSTTSPASPKAAISSTTASSTSPSPTKKPSSPSPPSNDGDNSPLPKRIHNEDLSESNNGEEVEEDLIVDKAPNLSNSRSFTDSSCATSVSSEEDEMNSMADLKSEDEDDFNASLKDLNKPPAAADVDDDATMADDINDDAYWNPQSLLVYGPGSRELDEFDFMDDEVYYYDLESMSERGRDDLLQIRKKVAVREPADVGRGVWKWNTDKSPKDSAPKMPTRNRSICLDEDDAIKNSDLWKPQRILLYDAERLPPSVTDSAMTIDSIPANDSADTDKLKKYNKSNGDNPPAAPNRTASTVSADSSGTISLNDIAPTLLTAKDRGLWARKPNAQRNEATGQFSPNDTWIFAPGQAPPKHVQAAGVWIIDDGTTKHPLATKRLDMEWPPKMDKERKALRPVGKLPMPASKRKSLAKEPSQVWIFGKGASELDPDSDHDIKEDRPTAMWKFNPDSDEPTEQELWQPQPILLHHRFEALDQDGNTDADGKPLLRGYWGYAPNAVPDENGNYQPGDTWVYAPGESPPIHWKPQGVWSPSKLKLDWPPKTDPLRRKTQDVGKLPKSPQKKDSSDITDKSRRMLVFGMGHPELKKPLTNRPKWKPKKKEGDDYVVKPKLKGGWKFGSDSEEPDNQEQWEPQEIVVREKGSDDDDDEKESDGVWGYDPDAKPDAAGNWDAQDMWVYGPGEEPPKNWKPQGGWAYPPGHAKPDWPPKTKDVPVNLRDVGKIPKQIEAPKWNAQPLMAYGKGNPDLKLPKSRDSYPKGTWKINSDGPANQRKWKPQEIWMYDKDHPPTEEPDGVWGYDPNAKPDDDGNWKPQDLWIYGPDENPPDDWKPQGTWTYPPGHTKSDWPPKNEESPHKTRGVGVNPEADNWKPQPLWAYGKDHPDLKKPKSKDGKPRGTWKVGPASDKPDDQDNWKPQEIWMYDKDHPPTEEPDGVWGYDPDAEPDDDGNWKPQDVWIYGPDETPPDDWKPQGAWTYPLGHTKPEWPPKTKDPPKSRAGSKLPKSNDAPKWNAQPLWAYGKGNPDLKQPKSKDGKPRGTWTVGPDSDEPDDQDKWKPQELWMYDKDHPPKGQSDGVWGYDPDAEPDDDGNWKPQDVWIYSPDKTPPEDWKPQGTWTYPPGKLAPDWPPKNEESPQKHRAVGKLPKGNGTDNWKPQPLWAYGKGHPDLKKPKSKDGKPRGTWKVEPDSDEPDDQDKWKPQEVWLYDKEHEPEILDKSQPHGVWGYDPDAKPDDDGNWKPQDMWIYGPGEEPPDDWTPQGMWTYPPDKKSPGKIKGEWPPRDGDASKGKGAPKKLGKKWPPSPDSNVKPRAVGKLPTTPFGSPKENPIKGVVPKLKAVKKEVPTVKEKVAEAEAPETPKGIQSSDSAKGKKRFSSPSIMGSLPRTPVHETQPASPETPGAAERRRDHPMMSDWMSPFDYKPKAKVKRNSTFK